MNHDDHVRLIKQAIDPSARTWADLGSGTGAFTLALRDVLGLASHIFSVDKDIHSLHEQQRLMDEKFPDSSIEYIHHNFIEYLELPLLDGILMANSLHYVKDQLAFLRRIRSYIKPGGRLILVEYNADTGNIWVPYPVSFTSFKRLADHAEYAEPTFLESIPSDFLKEIYSATCMNPLKFDINHRPW